MTIITNPSEYKVDGVFTIHASLKPYKGATESKHIVLNIHCKATPLADIITRAMSSTKITWANGTGRPKFATWTDRQTVDVDFTSPATTVKSRQENIDDAVLTFMKAGLDKDHALELATKAVDDPELIV